MTPASVADAKARLRKSLETDDWCELTSGECKALLDHIADLESKFAKSNADKAFGQGFSAYAESQGVAVIYGEDEDMWSEDEDGPEWGAR